MKRLRYYLSLYRTFIELCAAEALGFRFHFILLLIVDLFFYASSFGTVDFIFGHVGSIGPWRRDEFLFFVAFCLAIDQLHMSLFAMSFWEFSGDLRLGKLDFWLVKPANLFFIVFCRHIRFASLLLMPVVWGALVWFGSRIGLSALDWALLPVLVLLGLFLLVSIEILICASMFWTIESVGINFLRMQVQSVGRWPDFVYQYLFQKIFSFFIPVLLVASAPVHYLVDSGTGWLILIMLGVIAILWCLIGVAWNIGLRKYESASS